MKGVNITITREQVKALKRMLELVTKNTPPLERYGEFWVDHDSVSRVIQNARMSYAEGKARSQIRSAASLA